MNFSICSVCNSGYKWCNSAIIIFLISYFHSSYLNFEIHVLLNYFLNKCTNLFYATASKSLRFFSLSNGQTDRRLAAVRTYLPGVNFLCFDWLCWDYVTSTKNCMNEIFNRSLPIHYTTVSTLRIPNITKRYSG